MYNETKELQDNVQIHIGMSQTGEEMYERLMQQGKSRNIKRDYLMITQKNRKSKKRQCPIHYYYYYFSLAKGANGAYKQDLGLVECQTEKKLQLFFTSNAQKFER